MGAQITQVLAENGYPVCAYDVDPSRLRAGLDLIKSGKYGLNNSVRKGRISPDFAEEVLGRIQTTTSLDDSLASADFVLEAATEDLRIKQDIFRKAGQVTSMETVLATNTSTITIGKIGERLTLEEKKRLVGMHFFNPPQVMKLVEVIRTEFTSPEVLEKLDKVAVNIGKVPVAVLDHPGFVANRIGISVFAEASELLSKKIANVRDIDISMRLGYGYPLGPFELGDLVGLDSRLRNMEALYSETKEERFKPPEILKKLVSEGYLGDPKVRPGSKGGYYEYFQLQRYSTSE